MPVITFAQQKGGTGKTTACLGLALACKLERPKADVHVVDLDRQQSASTWIKQHDLPLVARQSWEGLRGTELVFCDTPGLEPVTTAEGLRRADLVVVPLRASMLDWQVSLMTIRAVLGAKKAAAWLPSQQDPRRAADRKLATETLPGAAAQKAIPDWPVLPGIRSLASVPEFLGGVSDVRAAEDFASAWHAAAKLLRR